MTNYRTAVTIAFCLVHSRVAGAFSSCGGGRGSSSSNNALVAPGRQQGPRLQMGLMDHNSNADVTEHGCHHRRRFVQSSFLSVLGAALGMKQTASASATEVVAPSPYSYYNTASDIPNSAIESHERLFGYVERVMDGDTLRVRHVPDLEAFLLRESSSASSSPRSSRGRSPPLADSTIVIRMYGIDAPETAKKHGETTTTGQPFGEEAKQLTKDLTYHKIVTVKLLRRDKYGRIVGEVDALSNARAPANNNDNGVVKDLSVELASRGLAVLYTGGGAEYDGKRDLLQQRIQAAQQAKLGVWSLGDDFVSPQEYKRMMNTAAGKQH